MRKWLKGILIFCAGICFGVLSTLGIQWIVREIDEAVEEQFAPIVQAHVQTIHFIVDKGRPPRNVDELTAHAKSDVNNQFDPTKFSELRFEALPDNGARMIWRLAPPGNASGTDIVSVTEVRKH